MPQDPPKKKKLTPAQKAALKKVSSKTKAAKASALARSSKPLDTSPSLRTLSAGQFNSSMRMQENKSVAANKGLQRAKKKK